LTLGAGVHVAETDGLAWRRAGRGRLAYEVRARHPRGGGRCACRLRDGSPGAVLKPTSRTAGTNRTGRDEPERLLDEGWFAEGETTTMPARLYGRNTVLTRINRMLDSLRERRGDALLIEGAPGSGRTRLIDAAEAEARRSGLPTIRVTPATINEPVSSPGLILADDADQL